MRDVDDYKAKTLWGILNRNLKAVRDRRIKPVFEPLNPSDTPMESFAKLEKLYNATVELHKRGGGVNHG